MNHALRLATVDVQPGVELDVHFDNARVRGDVVAVVGAMHARSIFDQDADLRTYCGRVLDRLSAWGLARLDARAEELAELCAALLRVLHDLGMCDVRPAGASGVWRLPGRPANEIN
jgi:hypothetical protein